MTNRNYQVRTRIGNITGAGFDQLWIPETIRGSGKYGVVLLHGASAAVTSTAHDWMNTAWPSLVKLAALLAREGIPCVAGHMDGNHYAKDAVTGTSGYINTALAYMAAQTGCSATKAHVFGASMGGGTGVRWAALNPAKAASVAGIVPMSSIEHAYTDNPNNVLPSGFSDGIATAWGLAFRTVTDAVTTNGSPVLTSAAADFVAGEEGKQLVRPYTQTQIPPNTKILSVDSESQVTMDKNATGSATGRTVGIGAPLPMTGTAGADLIGDHAPLLATNSIPSRFYYASDDAFVYPADVVALAAAAGGTAYNLGAVGHDNDAGEAMEAIGGGSDFSDYIAWLKSNGA